MGVIKLDQYKFNQDHYTMIVQSIIDGYREYINHRRDRASKMTISSAFAWTKGNFIESEIANTCEEFGFSFHKSNAGPTWQYLQFSDDETKRLFLIKNGGYFNPESFANSKIPIPGKDSGNSRTYLQNLAEINDNITFNPNNLPNKNTQNSTDQLCFSYLSGSVVTKQLALFKSKYESFHIITYEFDQSQQISKIVHYLPNASDNIAYQITDLTDYIIGAELTEEDREIIAPVKEDFIDPIAYDFGIIDDEQVTKES